MKIRLKYILFILIIIFCHTNSEAQWKNEYNYFSFSGGITNGIVNNQDLGITNKSLLIDTTYEYLINKDKTQFRYAMGFNLGIYYNMDFKNDDMGFTIGLQYQLMPYKTTYFSEIDDSEIREKNLIRTFSLPIYFKYGDRFYEPMRYIFFGLQPNYYFGGKLHYEFINGSTSYNLSKEMLTGFSMGFLLGFNYSIFNLRVEYTPGTIIKDGPINVVNYSNNNGHSKHFFSVQTNINIPLNSWTRFPRVQDFEMWMRRLLK